MDKKTSQLNEEKIFSDIFYQPENLWIGNKAIRELQKQSKLSRKKVKEFLAKQSLWQVHIPPPKSINHPHYEITTPNQLHQFDLMYMPGNKLYGNVYKYILTGIDTASRYKVTRPLRTKKASDVAEMIADIYKKGPLTWPTMVQVDNGSEFKADVTKLFEKNSVEIKRATTKYKHTHTAFVEAFNKELAKLLFKIQDAQELQDPDKPSKTWVKYLQTIVKKMNNTETSMIGMKPKDAIKLKEVELVKSEEFKDEKVLNESGLYRYLLQPGEEHSDQRKRATDFIWSKTSYRLDKIVQEPNNRILYYLQNGPNRSFVSEELMLIPENTEEPPSHVKDW